MEMVLDCPYCRAQSVGFTHEADSRRPTGRTRGGGAIFDTLMRCRRCEEAVIVVLAAPSGGYVSGTDPLEVGDFRSIEGDPAHYGYMRLGIYPRPVRLAAPAHSPPRIAADYTDALHNLQQQRPQPAGMMFRRVLEQAIGEIARAQGVTLKKGRTLKARLEALSASGLLAPEMYALADQIRDDGNEAAHGDTPFDMASAEQLRDFTELFLTYVFALPAKMARVKQPRAEPAAAPEKSS